MELNTQSDGRVAIISIAGRLDGTTTGTLEQAATTVVNGGSSRLIFDLRRVNYVSSAGLRTLLIAAKRANAAGGGIALFGLQPAVEEVMTTSGFATIVAICDSEAEARASLDA